MGAQEPTYFIAEIGSNFDGSFERALKLIELAAESGADAAKFQAFKADRIVSQVGFEGLKRGFQSEWDKPVYEVYEDAELPRDWIPDLQEKAHEEGIDFLCTPYDFEAVDILSELDIPAMKIGSGDITWHEFLEYTGQVGVPVILSTGASKLAEIEQAVDILEEAGTEEISLLQCVTNYPSSFETANIRAIETLSEAFEVPVGYSDHTPGSTVPLGTVALGGCIIEKHFTDDNDRDGPDHPFAMEPAGFDHMVKSVRQLETALGSTRKHLYTADEAESVVLQRRCLRAATDLSTGEKIDDNDLKALRPAPEDAIEPSRKNQVVGRTVEQEINEGEYLSWDKI